MFKFFALDIKVTWSPKLYLWTSPLPVQS